MKEHIKKARRCLEDELRKALLQLEKAGLDEEAEHLIFRLRQFLTEKLALYLKNR